jgi:hypothetical protein
MRRVCTCGQRPLFSARPGRRAPCICGMGGIDWVRLAGVAGATAMLAGVLLAAFLFGARAHESWISRGGHRNGAGEWCCGVGDCFVVPKEHVFETRDGYVLVFGPVLGAGPAYHELVPFAEAQPSPDGEFWRCQRPDRSRRCFFAPPPST